MSIQVNPNSGILPADWLSLLEKAGITATQGTGDKPALTFTTVVDGTERKITVNVPDDLEIPETVDQAAIEALCAKLAADPDLAIDPKAVEQLRDLLVAALATPDVTGNIGSLPASKNVMFDLYKLMALLVEVAQKQRDSSRELRQSESALIQNSIQSQAEIQRTAARNSMIASACCCLVQLGAMFYSTAKQASAFKSQLSTLKTSGVDVARQNSSMIKAGATLAGAQKQLNAVTGEVGHETAVRIENQGFTKALVAKGRFDAANIQRTVEAPKIQRLQSDQPLQPGDVPPGSKLAQAQQHLAEFREYQQLDAKGAERTFADNQRMLELRNYQGTNEQQFTSEVRTARNELVTELRANSKTSIETARKNVNAELDTALAQYEQAYDSALQNRLAATADTPKAEIAELDAKLKTAAAELKYARAFAIEMRAQPGVATEAERTLAIQNAKTDVRMAQQIQEGDATYLQARHDIGKWEARNQLITALGNCGQNLIQNYYAMRQADATVASATQERAKEDLEQIKDLYTQAGELVTAVVQLMQAITAAENQSMRDAIQV
jgi:hypothetical protein